MSYCYSRDEKTFYGRFDTIEEATDEALDGHESGWVGEAVPPPQPETFWRADDWLEHVSVQDEYSGDWAEDWDESTKEQRAELEAEVQSVMAAWLDKHGLRPKFFNVKNSKLVTSPTSGE